MKEIAEKLLKLVTETQSKYEDMVEAADNAHALKSKMVAEAERLSQKEKALASKEAALGGLASIADREEQVRAKDRTLRLKEEQLKETETVLATKATEMNKLKEELETSKKLYSEKNVRLDAELEKLKKDRENMRIDLLKELSAKI